MRRIALVMITLALAGCEGLGGDKTVTAVDPGALPPLSSREQSLIFAGDGALQQGNPDEAERDYLTAASGSKGRIEAHLALANLYSKQGMVAKERDILERALQLQPGHPFANYMLGKTYLDLSEYDRARDAFKKGLASRPMDADLLTGEALSEDMLGNHKAAQAGYLAALKQGSETSRNVVRTNLAMSYILSNDPQKAVDLLREEASKPGAAAVSRHNLALAYGLLGRNNDAKTVLGGDIDEPTRQLTVARMKAYHEQRMSVSNSPAVVPMINQVEEPKEITPMHPAPVISYPATAAKPAVKNEARAKPVAAKPVVVQAAPITVTAPKPVKAASDAHKASGLAPAATAPYDPTQDPNYIPGLVDPDASN